MRLSMLRGLFVCSLLLVGSAGAQTVRFNTSVGAFDMQLNPTNNANLQPLVDNMLANVAAGVYHCSVVNRAAEGFVLQIGSFKTDSIQVPEIQVNGFDATDSLNPVIVDANNDGQVDFNTTGLTNTRGTVSLALSAGNANSGSASFFINLANTNTFLDSQGFVPFATIADLATVDRIMALTQTDLSATVNQSGSLAYIDVPLTSDGNLVVIETAGVISPSSVSFKGPLLNALGITPPTNSVTDPPAMASAATSASLLSGSSSSLVSAAVTSSAAVPEPSAVLLGLLGLGTLGLLFLQH
jgi:cyclophilin family peptidyl-prolyl cis-trans isomerase